MTVPSDRRLCTAIVHHTATTPGKRKVCMTHRLAAEGAVLLIVGTIRQGCRRSRMRRLVLLPCAVALLSKQSVEVLNIEQSLCAAELLCDLAEAVLHGAVEVAVKGWHELVKCCRDALSKATEGA